MGKNGYKVRGYILTYSSHLYQLIKTVVNYRLRNRIWEKNQVQRYADDNFYAFTRDKTLCLFTNSDKIIDRVITYHPYSEGQRLCNLMNNSECVYVKGGQIKVSLQADFKIYYLN